MSPLGRGAFPNGDALLKQSRKRPPVSGVEWLDVDYVPVCAITAR